MSGESQDWDMEAFWDIATAALGDGIAELHDQAEAMRSSTEQLIAKLESLCEEAETVSEQVNIVRKYMLAWGQEELRRKQLEALLVLWKQYTYSESNEDWKRFARCADGMKEAPLHAKEAEAVFTDSGEEVRDPD